MRSTVTPANKGSEDVKPGEQTHASGTGHHMKTVAKKCKKTFSFKTFFIFYLLLGLESKMTGRTIFKRL